MNPKKIYLLVAAIASIVLLFMEPTYHLWLTKRITDPDHSIVYQAEHLDLEDRYAYRYGESYLILDHITRSFRGVDGILLLLPPNDFLKANGIGNILVPEPIVFYYFTGLKSATADNSLAREANIVLIATPKGFKLKKITSLDERDSMIKVYNKYHY